MRVLPEYEAHIDHIAGEVRYSLSFSSNADRAAFLKVALQSAAVHHIGGEDGYCDRCGKSLLAGKER